MRNKLLIITDAWRPQTNGVVRCWTSVGEELVNRGHDVDFLTPENFWRLPMPTYPEIQLALAPRAAIADEIKKFAPDHIHIATEGPLGFQARLHCEWSGLSFTTSYHTRFPEYLAARAPIPEGVSYAYLRWFHSGASATLVPTASVGRDLEQRGFQHIVEWTRGVDTNVFHPGEKTAFAHLPGPHMLYVGRVAIEKNVDAFLSLDLPGTKIVVGDGPQLEELKRRFPDVVFLGPQYGEELSASYRSADVFVFPSRTDTFGNVMVEAMASGLPVAAYPVMGPIDVLSDPRAGVMDDDLAVAIRKALTLSSDDAVAHARRFTWARAADILCDHLVPMEKMRSHAA